MDKNSFLIELSESERTMFGRVEFADQPMEQKVFSSIYELEGQVCIGGFAQLFSNIDSEETNFAPQALRLVGAYRCEDIVARALRVVSGIDLQAGQGTWEEFLQRLGQKADDELWRLTQEFIAYPDDLTELLFAYVKARPQVFGPVPVK